MTMPWMTLILLTAVNGHDSRPTLRAHLQFKAPDTGTIRPLAEYLAARMFAKIGVRLEWIAEEHSGKFPVPAIVIEAISPAPPTAMPGVLGYAELCHGGRVTVFLDRIEQTKYPAFVLAHVIVHELAHMVQGINRHSDAGIMKPHWTGRELLDMRSRPFPFSHEDVVLIYDGLSRNGDASADRIDSRTPLSASGSSAPGMVTNRMCKFKKDWD
jgi:hypothetical protein